MQTITAYISVPDNKQSDTNYTNRKFKTGVMLQPLPIMNYDYS